MSERPTELELDGAVARREGQVKKVTTFDARHPAVAIAQIADSRESGVQGDWWTDGYALIRLPEPGSEPRGLEISCGHYRVTDPCGCDCACCSECAGEVTTPACTTLAACKQLAVEWGGPNRYARIDLSAILHRVEQAGASTLVAVSRDSQPVCALGGTAVRCATGDGVHAHVQTRLFRAATRPVWPTDLWTLVSSGEMFEALVGRSGAGTVTAVIMCARVRCGRP